MKSDKPDNRLPWSQQRGETAESYNVNYEGANGQRITNDNLGGGFETFLTQACTNLLNTTSGAVYLCMSPSERHQGLKPMAVACDYDGMNTFFSTTIERVDPSTATKSEPK
jgi:hypothetical protein